MNVTFMALKVKISSNPDFKKKSASLPSSNQSFTHDLHSTCSMDVPKEHLSTLLDHGLYSSAQMLKMYKQALQYHKIIPKQNAAASLTNRSSLSAANRSSSPGFLNPSALNENEVKFKIATCHNSLNENRAALAEMEGIPSKSRNLEMNLMMAKLYRNSRHTRAAIGCFKECFEEIASRFNDNLNGSKSLIDFYYNIGSLVLVKDQTSNSDVHLRDADKIFRSLKDLSQSDGRWRYSSNNPESSTDAAGIALETLAGVISLASSEIDRSLVANLKTDVVKLFDSIKRYDDGACYFDDKLVGAHGDQGPLSASSSVVRGITALAGVTSESLNLPGEKILGLAKFFFGIGVPGSAKELYHQIDALACLEKIRGSIPLILSLPSSVLSVTRADQLKVRVNTVLGSVALPLTVNLRQIFVSGSKDASVVNQKLKFDPDSGMHVLETLPTNIDIGNYVFSFEIVLDDPEYKKTYVIGGRTKVPIHLTGVVQVENEEIAVLDSDLGSVEMHKKPDLSGGSAVSLYAKHLQKLRLSFTLTSPSGNAFKPHQAFLSLRHESGVEHIFVVSNTGKKFEIVLDFLGLVEKFYYLSGKYDIQLTVGDSVMENSFLQPLGIIELDLPDAPEKTASPPPQSVDPYSRYGPKAEITHIYRAPEKRPPRELSLVFLGLVLLPFFGFLAGLFYLRANLNNFPRSTSPATFAFFFHLGIAAVLSLYAFFWFKLDLFTTLKALGILGMFLMFVGHKTLSHLASSSSKLKST